MSLRERYYAYWGLMRAPFQKAPDPEMYFDQHYSVENAICKTLFAIEESNEFLAVIIGDVGLGKTTALHMIINSIAQGKYRFAFVTNPDLTLHKLMKEIIGQLSRKSSRENPRAATLEAFQHILFEARDEGRKVLIFIDEAHAMQLSTLDDLKLLTDMQRDDEHLFTLILAGRPEFTQRLEHPRCSHLFQRIGIYHQLAKIDSQELIQQYIEHRLKRAGALHRIFTDDAYEALWQYSENGVPRLINKIAKLAMKAGQAQGLAAIDANIVRQMAGHFRRVSGALTSEGSECTTELPTWPTSPPSSTDGEVPTVLPGDQPPAPPLMTNMVRFPEHVQPQANELPRDQRLKLAGQLASDVLKRYPHLIQQLGSTNDPIPAWTILRNVVLQQLDQVLAKEPMPGEQILES